MLFKNGFENIKGNEISSKKCRLRLIQGSYQKNENKSENFKIKSCKIKMYFYTLKQF